MAAVFWKKALKTDCTQHASNMANILGHIAAKEPVLFLKSWWRQKDIGLNNIQIQMIANVALCLLGVLIGNLFSNLRQELCVSVASKSTNSASKQNT